MNQFDRDRSELGWKAADEDLTATLEEVRGLLTRRDRIRARVIAASEDGGELQALDEAFTGAQDKLAARVPRLLAAVQAAIRYHPQMITADGTVCATCSRKYPPDFWPCPEVSDITSALTGKHSAGSEQRDRHHPS